MSDHLDSFHDRLFERLDRVEAGLLRYFDDDWLSLDGVARHVDDVIEEIDGCRAQLVRTCIATSTWLEEQARLQDQLRYELTPLLGGLRRFVAEEFGADSPRMREFGFEPVTRASCEDDVADDDVVVHDEIVDDDDIDYVSRIVG